MTSNSKRRTKLTVTFNNSKKEILSYDDCKSCIRNFASNGFIVAINNGNISSELLLKSTIFVLFGPREDLEIGEIIQLRKYLNRGGKLLVTDNCGKSSNINMLLDMYGIKFQKDSVFRTHFAKNYFHPRESFISDGVVNESIYSLSMKVEEYSDTLSGKFFPVVYPFGCTLNVQRSSIILLSSGSVCLPFNRPICAFHRDMSSDGRIVAVGSTMMFSDGYIRKEYNLRFLRIILKLLTDENIKLNLTDAQYPDVADYVMVPCIPEWSSYPFSYLQEIDEIPYDINLFCQNKLSQFDNRHGIKVMEAYKELNIEHKKLNIIRPKFESPLHKILPALIPPRFRDLVPPALELMDLEESFMSATTRLHRLTFKCTDSDLDFYITEYGKIMNIPQNQNPKSVLYYICNKLSSLKRRLFL